MLLDFEGSDIRNLAFFTAVLEPLKKNILRLRLNRLPFYLKWLKEIRNCNER